MFSLTKHQTKIASFNPRAEKHGEENVLAADLKIEATVHSATLDLFDKKLRPMFFRKAEIGEQQSLIEGDDLIGLRLPQIKGFTWDEDFPGYTIEIGSGLDIGKPLVITEVELSKFKFEPAEGGAVKLTLSASFHPSAELSGALCALIQDTVELTLLPPSAAQQKAA